MTAWQWGRAHIAKFPNPVFSRIPVLRDWIDVAIPTGGGFDTVNRGSMTIRDDEHPYEHRHGAGLRIITDLADPAASRMIAAPGQSGNPLSPHFADLLRRWRRFRLPRARQSRGGRNPDLGTRTMIDLPVTIDDIRRAAAAISGAIVRTPLIRAAALSEIAGCEVFLKLETQQSTGSFKERGALNKLLTLGTARAAGRGCRDVGRQSRAGCRLSRPPSRHPGDDRDARRDALHEDRSHRGVGRQGRVARRQPCRCEPRRRCARPRARPRAGPSL